MICGVCGNSLQPEDNVCSKCGSQISKNKTVEKKSNFQELSLDDKDTNDNEEKNDFELPQPIDLNTTLEPIELDNKLTKEEPQYQKVNIVNKNQVNNNVVNNQQVQPVVQINNAAQNVVQTNNTKQKTQNKIQKSKVNKNEKKETENSTNNKDVKIEVNIPNHAKKNESNVKIEVKVPDNREKNNIIRIISVSMVVLGIMIIGYAYIISSRDLSQNNQEPNKPENVEKVPEIATFAFKGYKVAYLDNFTPRIENDILVLDGKNVLFQTNIIPNTTKEALTNDKAYLKQKITQNGYYITSEDDIVREGIDFYMLQLTSTIDNEKYNYEYYFTVKDNNLFEILVYESKEGNFTTISNLLKTIVNETKKVGQ